MAFSDLPMEVLDIITQYLADHGKIAHYATISLPFQGAVEKRLFSRLELSSLDLDSFGRSLDSHENRKAAIRTITLVVVLPTYSEKACSWFETEADKTENDEAFTAAVAHLFRLLATCDDVNRARSIHLLLGRAHSPTDIDQRGSERLAADRLAVASGQRKDLFQHRYEHSYVQLLRSECLPVLHRVRKLNLNTCMDRKLAPATAVHISSRFPNLQTIEWNVLDMERKYRKLRTDLRQDFAEALSTLHLQETTELKLYCKHESSSNEAYTNFDVRRECSGSLDSFSALLGSFLRTSNLVKIELGNPICIGPDVFNIVDPSARQGAVTWPCLQTFLVTISAVRPDGGWYFDRSTNERPPHDDSDDENESEYVQLAAWRGEDINTDTDSSSSGFESDDSFFEETERPPDHYNPARERYRQGLSPTRGFRTVPSPALEDLLKAAANATPHMPALRTFSVGADIQPSRRTEYDRKEFEFVFSLAGYENWTDQEVGDQEHRRLTWVGPREWRPSRELAEAWREVLGDDGIVRYQDW